MVNAVANIRGGELKRLELSLSASCAWHMVSNG